MYDIKVESGDLLYDIMQDPSLKIKTVDFPEVKYGSRNMFLNRLSKWEMHELESIIEYSIRWGMKKALSDHGIPYEEGD